FRLTNALEPGKKTGAGQRLLRSVGLKECIEKAAEASAWHDFKRSRRRAPEEENPWRRGIGIGLAFKNVGLGNASERDKAAAEITLEPGDRVKIRTGAAEVGQGMTTILCQLAAEALGVPYEQVDIEIGDTLRTPESGVSSASRQTFMTGNAVVRAAQELKEQILRVASDVMDVPFELLNIEEGVIRAGGNPNLLMTLGELCQRAGERTFKADNLYVPPITHAWGESDEEGYKTHVTYGYGAQIAEVRVNEDTGEVVVDRIVAAHDVGRTIHPAAVRGQIGGGIVQGLGYTLWEEYRVENGKPKSKLFKKCGMPGIDQVPKIKTIIVEDHEADGPFGAKGVGEISTVPTAPAIANAIYDAVGVRITDLPVTPAKVRAALRARQKLVETAS
ncbi:MAG: molybdopterin-dependent oxidoreductase, partial [Nitrospinota bacterium]|nr:molybdopterin-dependent oxidoreductase [Nitrospinota bacterium]